MRLLLAVLFLWPRHSEGTPHIVMVIADDLGWNDVSFHGSRQIPTPNIDSLAADGVVLNNYYVSPLCTPSRGALMSGMHPIHIGFQHDVIYAAAPWGLPLELTTMPQYLKALGYATHAVGKWHLGFYKQEYTPLSRGFDSHFGYWSGKESYFDHTDLTDGGWGLNLHDNMDFVKDAIGKYSTHLYTDRSVKIIDQHNKTQPLFLYVSHLAVHTGNNYSLLEAPAESVAKFPYIRDKSRRIFAGMLSALDDSVGSIFEALHRNQMLDDTLFVFTTDNGAPAGGIGFSPGSNWPLRGSKYTLWEGGIRGSALIWSPLLQNPGRVSEQLMHISDWLPTFYSAAGGTITDLGNIYGMNMWPSLRDNLPSPRRELLHNIDPVWQVSALRKDEFKLVNGSLFGGQYDGWYPTISHSDTVCDYEYISQVNNSIVAKILYERGQSIDILKNLQNSQVTCNQITYVACKPTEAPCLFNIAQDPCEYNNIASQNPQKVEELLKKLRKYEVTAAPPLKTPEDEEADPKYYGYVWTNWKDSV